MPNQEIVVFAKTNFRNKERAFGIKRPDRRQHMYIIGKTGTGKTTLLENLAVQDIIQGKGVCIVDPHGEFVENVASKIPANRIKDVVYFNAADTEYPIGFNILEVPDPKYKHMVASDLMGIFTKIWANVWSSRMEYILSNCIFALLDTPGTTLLGIPRILVDKDYRQQIIRNIKDPVVKSFWVHEYEGWRDQFRNEAIVPIQNKVGQFLSTSLIRNVVGQTKSTINIQELMNNEKILLINVSKGRIGEDNSALLGAMFITKIQLAAMERVRIPTEQRKDFYLYVDEFQNFATESFASILSEARKYRLNLVVAHQYIGQLMTGEVTKVRDAVFGNVGTMISFRVGAADAEFLEKEFEPEFNAQDIINLPNYNVYLKLMVDGITSRPFSALTLPPLALAQSEDSKAAVIEFSRKNFSRPRLKVEEEVSHWSGMAPITTTGSGLRRSTEQTGRHESERRERPGISDERRPQFKYADTLADMGIEFKHREKPSSLMGALESKEKEIKHEEKKEKFMPLGELSKHQEPKQPIKHQPIPDNKQTPSTSSGQAEKEPVPSQPKGKTPSIEDLKEAIKKALETPTDSD